MNGENRNNRKEKSVSALDLLGKLKGDIKGAKVPEKSPSDAKSLQKEEAEIKTASSDTEASVGVEIEEKTGGTVAGEIISDSEASADIEDIMRKYMTAEEAEKYSKPKSFDWENKADVEKSDAEPDTAIENTDEKSDGVLSGIVSSDNGEEDESDDDVFIGQLHTVETSDTTLNSDTEAKVTAPAEESGADKADNDAASAEDSGSDEIHYSIEGGDDVIADAGDSVACVTYDANNSDYAADDTDDYTEEDFGGEGCEGIDDTDVQLMVAFGMNDELEKTVGAEKAAELGTEEGEEDGNSSGGSGTNEEKYEEFTSPDQAKKIIGSYRKKYRILLLKLLGCGILALISFLYENIALFGGSLPSAMMPAHYPVVNIMIGLQLLVLACAIVPDIIIKGAAAIKKKTLIPESAVAVLVAGNVIYDILLIFFTTKANQASVKLYAFPVIVCILIAVVMQFFDLRREIFSFNIASSKNVKYAIKGLTDEQAELENEAFHDFLSEEASIFHIGRTKFLDNFYAKMRTEVKQRSATRIIIPVALAVSVIFFIIDLFIDRSVQQALAVSQFTLTMGLPFTALLVFSYPFFAASKLAYANGSAIIGEASLEEYSTASAITFEDKDVFPSYGVIVKSIKTFGSGRIDNIIYNAASLFIRAGGPLAEVFEGATKELEHSNDVQIIDAVSGGLEATVDGAHIYCGKPDYIMDKGFNTFYDPDDETVAEDGNISVMYMALEGEIVAKFYIQYVVDPDFETTLRQLCKIGMCVGIKTFDPNIDEEMLDSKLRIDNYRLKILRCRTLDDLVVTEDRMSSGVISKKSAKALMQTYYLCDKVLYAMKTGVMIKSIAMVFSFVIAAFAILAKASGSIYSLYVALYQLVWIIPTVVVSKLCVGKSA